MYWRPINTMRLTRDFSSRPYWKYQVRFPAGPTNILGHSIFVPIPHGCTKVNWQRMLSIVNCESAHGILRSCLGRNARINKKNVLYWWIEVSNQLIILLGAVFYTINVREPVEVTIEIGARISITILQYFHLLSAWSSDPVASHRCILSALSGISQIVRCIRDREVKITWLEMMMSTIRLVCSLFYPFHCFLLIDISACRNLLYKGL